MRTPIGDHNLDQHLTAFADGELNAAQSVALLEYLLEHPGSVESSLLMMRDQQRLRLAAEHLVRAESGPLPEALRERVTGLSVAAADPPTARGRGAASRLRVWPWLAAGVVLLFLGALVGRFALQHPRPRVVVGEPELVVPVVMIVKAGRVHAECSRLAEELHSAGYAREYGALADAVERDLAGPNPFPDLSQIGYRYVGAEPCPDTPHGTVHLLYRESGPQPQGAISIFVQPNAGQFAIEPGRLYELAGSRSPFPMFAWRTEQVVYFLLADDGDAAARALRVINGTPKL